jgi:hypothetical protein
MQVQTFHSSGFHLLATSRKSRRLFSSLLVMGCVALAGATCQTALAQEADTPPAVRDTFSISSAYFENNYANNVDYAQFTIDAHSASGRLAMYGYDKFADVLNRPWSRVAYVGATGSLTGFMGVGLSYHEWGHASRIVALGGTATMSKCLGEGCPAPRDFFGYAASQFYTFEGGSVRSSGRIDQANASSGRAWENIITGGGVNNDELVADKYAEQHFLNGSGHLFGSSAGNLSIALYSPKGPNGDVGRAAAHYRATGVDKQITERDLININKLSLISGANVTTARALYEFAVNGNYTTKPWTINGFLIPNQYNYLSSRGITRKWVSGYEWDESTKILGSYEYVVRGDSFHEPGIGIYKNFGDWDALVKVSGKTVSWANVETAFSKRLNKNWKLTATAYVWDSRSLLGERNSLKLKDDKTRQGSVGAAYEY